MVRMPLPIDTTCQMPRFGSLSDLGAVSLLQWMLRHDTTASQGREAKFVADLAEYLAGFGLTSRIWPGDQGRSNLICEINGVQPGPHLVFCAHCDTVPLGRREWQYDPFGGIIADGRIHGRGSCDMKGGLAALTASFLDIAARNPADLSGRLTLAVTYGEETGSEGALVMARDGSLGPFDAMVIGEPTLNRVVRSHKGALWLRATAIGRTGHGSMPSMGVNAVNMLIDLVDRVQSMAGLGQNHALLGRPTLCLTRLEGGTQVNVIPDRAIAEFDLRSLPGQPHAALLTEIRAAAAAVEVAMPGGSLAVDIISTLPALDMPAHSPLVLRAEAARQAAGLPALLAEGASYFTDGSVLQDLGPVVVLGPGDPAQAHQTDEHLTLEDFHTARRIYTHLANDMLLCGQSARPNRQ